MKKNILLLFFYRRNLQFRYKYINKYYTINIYIQNNLNEFSNKNKFKYFNLHKDYFPFSLLAL